MTGDAVADGRARRRPTTAVLVCLAAYVAFAHTADTLALRGVQVPFDWRMFSWRLGNGFDAFKFVAWFVIPLAFSFRRLEAGYFTFSRWRKLDWVMLGVLSALGAAAMALIPFVPSLKAVYGSFTRPDQAVGLLIWTLSWLIGWEFLHRYVLLTHIDARWPNWAWLVIPVIEGAYHYGQQKPWPETLGMVALSLVVTSWARWRRNVLLPFLVHLVIELELILFLLVMMRR